MKPMETPENVAGGGGSLRDKTLACRGARTQIHMVEEEPTNTGRFAWEEPRENRADNDAAQKKNVVVSRSSQS